jgi:hypothetical protein
LTGLAATTQYDVQARTFCSTSGGSDWSSTVQFTTTGASGCYLPPVMTATTVNSTSITVTWPAISGAAYYEFRYQAFGASTWTSGGTLTGTNTSKVFTGLTAGTQYLIQARTFCSSTAGSDWSSSLLVTTEDPALCNSAPILTLATLTATSAKFTWPAGQGSAWYEFRYRVVGSLIWTSAGTLTGTAVSKTITGLTPGTNYEFQAKSYCSSTSYSIWGASNVFTTPLAMVLVDSTPTEETNGLTSDKAIDETMNNMIVSVFPNPTTGIFQVQFELQEEATVQFLITDQLGRVVSNQTMKLPGGAIRLDQDLENKEVGIYTLQLLKEGELIHISKINKQ